MWHVWETVEVNTDHWKDLGVDGRVKLNEVRGMDWISLCVIDRAF